MAELFASGRIAALILVFMSLEAVFFLVVPRLAGKGGRSWFDPLANLASGAALMLALRCALTGTARPWTALFPGLSLVAHLIDVWRRAH